MPLTPSPTPPLEQELRARLHSAPSQRLRWAEVMDLALYHPEHGYYSVAPRRIGRSGDFYTAVSVGPLYGQLLAQVALEAWWNAGKPRDFWVIEQGAHDGTLMRDVWAGLQHSELGKVARLAIIEERESYRLAQRTTLGDTPLRWLGSVAELDAVDGLFLCNELLDAFAVHRLKWTQGRWHEGFVVDAGGELGWHWLPSDLSPASTDELPEGFTTEMHLAASTWMQSLCASPFRGEVLIADYGYEAGEYYAPERSNGTLRRYQEHTSDTDLLRELGRSDLTAHINFTALIEIAQAHGRTVKRFLPQGRFLTLAAESWLRSLEGKPPDAATRALLRQFQTLTHPSHMGAAFRMLLLDRARG